MSSNAASPFDETSWLLAEWSRWAKINNVLSRLKFPSQTPYQRLRGSGLPEPLISDHMATEIDCSLARLRYLDQ